MATENTVSDTNTDNEIFDINEAEAILNGDVPTKSIEKSQKDSQPDEKSQEEITPNSNTTNAK